MNESKPDTPCPAPPPLQLPERQSDGHKGVYGRVALIGGSRGMTGAIAFSAIAALKTGSGLVSALVPDRCLESVAAHHPALMTVPLPDDDHGRFAPSAAETLLTLSSLAEIRQRGSNSRAAIGIGPGMTTVPGSLRIVERCLSWNQVPRVFDADAINALAQLDWPRNQEATGPLVLTPHPGEFARLTGVSPTDRDRQILRANELAAETSTVIVLKGGPTVVVNGTERFTNGTGNPGMATGGSGDVLTGIITSLLGLGLASWDAARLGVWIHGRAGDLAAQRYGPAGMTAVEILEFLPMAVDETQAPTS